MSTYNAYFELYVLREDVTFNPIPERAYEMRAQAEDEGGLCNIQIPPYPEKGTTNSYLDAVVSSVTANPNCAVNICRSKGCHACSVEGGNTTCAPCGESSDCDGLENVEEYRYCDCDVVVTVDELNQFALYTGKKVSSQICLMLQSNSQNFLSNLSSIV